MPRFKSKLCDGKQFLKDVLIVWPNRHHDLACASYENVFGVCKLIATIDVWLNKLAFKFPACLHYRSLHTKNLYEHNQHDCAHL